MTLAAVWIEEPPSGAPALCFASDSRTSPGPIEGVTKVVLFGRTDIAGVWAGDFRYAALLVSHIDAVLTATDAMRSRDIDVARALMAAGFSAREHVEAAVKPAVHRGQLNPIAQEPEVTSVILGGYSLEKGRFVTLRIDWTPYTDGWRPSVAPVAAERIVFIGDGRKRAKQRAKAARRSRTTGQPADSWRMEPLAAIDFARVDPVEATVGGDLQLAKAFRHGNVRAFAIRDPHNGDRVSVRGSRLKTSAALEATNRGMLVDLSSWRLNDAQYGR